MESDCRIEADVTLQYVNPATQALDRTRQLRHVCVCVQFPGSFYRYGTTGTTVEASAISHP